jgi:hypothetical protein
VGFELVDGYLLGDPVSKPAAVEALLAERSPDPTAAPFYRALEAVGAKAADEAFIALRLVLSGRAPSDAAVRRLRALSAVARGCATGDASGVAKAFQRDAQVLNDLADARNRSPVELGAAARAIFVSELTPIPAA